MRESVVVVPVKELRRIVIGVIVLVMLVLVVLVVRNQFFHGAGLSVFRSPTINEEIESGAYQAVFLSGGQVFFGHLAQQSDEYFLLTDIFYLTVADQPGAQGQLVQRGREIQGPREPMIIPARSVLFIENLRADGDVATAIRKFKAGELPLATPPATTPPPRPSGTTAPSPTR